MQAIKGRLIPCRDSSVDLLSRIKSLEEQVAVLTAEKNASDQCIASFALDLHNPLVSAITSASALESLCADDNARSVARVLRRTLRQMERILLDLLDVRQIISRQAPHLPLEKYDLIPDCQSLIDEVGSRFNRIINLTAPRSLPVRCSRPCIERVLNNLLEHAAKQVSAGLPINVRIESNSGEVRFQVQHGAGSDGSTFGKQDGSTFGKQDGSTFGKQDGSTFGALDGSDLPLKLRAVMAIVDWHHGTIQDCKLPNGAGTLMCLPIVDSGT